MTVSFTRKGCDASYSLPTGIQLKAAGRTAIMRYITDPGPGNKGMTIFEAHDYGAHGIAYGLVWELGEKAVLEGYAQGVSDAEHAQANLNALAAQSGGPSRRRPIYSAIDFDITETQLSTARAYFQGWNTVIPASRTGVYGSGLAIDYLFDHKVAAFGWWVKVASAWGNKHIPNSSRVHIQQVQNGQRLGSGTVDFDLMRSTGNWGQKGLVLASATKPVPTPPKADPITYYTVRDRDTLSGIAAKYGVTLARVEQLNPAIKDFDLIKPGERIRVR